MNRTFTGNRQAVGTPTLNKNQYYQLIRQIKKARLLAQTGQTADTSRQKGQGENNTNE